MLVTLTADDIEALLDQAISHMPPTRSDLQQQQMEQATEAALRALAEPLIQGVCPAITDCEQSIIAALGNNDVPPWMVRSRAVLVFRDLMRDPDYRQSFDTLPRDDRDVMLADWARLAADLYASYPDKQISGRPDLALTILSGDDPDLRHFLSLELQIDTSEPARGGLLSRLTNRKAARPQATHRSGPTLDRRPAAAPASNARFNAQQGIKRVSNAERLSVTFPHKQQPAPATATEAGGKSARVSARPKFDRPVATQQPMATTAANPAQPPRQAPVLPERTGPESFIGRIQEQFAQRGLPPVSVGIATEAARIMVQSVLNGRVPDFHEIEYEVMVRQGDGIAAGAVRTWTIHAFMECMREPWFRDRYNALPSQARSEAVWIWAKLAADWFDVPEKMREFWVRSLSGGDPVLAAAVSRAFAARTPSAPIRPQAVTMPAAINQLVEELEQREAMMPADVVMVDDMPPAINHMAASVPASAPSPISEPPSTPWQGSIRTSQTPSTFKPAGLSLPHQAAPIGGIERRTPRAENNLSFPRALNGPRMRAVAGAENAPGHMPLGAAEIRYSIPE